MGQVGHTGDVGQGLVSGYAGRDAATLGIIA